jgi:glutathione peroxidase
MNGRMSRRSGLMALAAVGVLAAMAGPRRARAQGAETTAHDFAFLDIDGAPLRLNQFAGKAMLVVNTASRCGYTGQYDGLQQLWTQYRDRGLVVIGVPSDEFNQELSSEDAIRDFCEANFGIDFPMTSITRLRGTDRHPFYAWAERALGRENAPRWNFHKYLIDGQGRAVAAFPSRVEPMSRQMISAVEALLPPAG